MRDAHQTQALYRFCVVVWMASAVLAIGLGTFLMFPGATPQETAVEAQTPTVSATQTQTQTIPSERSNTSRVSVTNSTLTVVLGTADNHINFSVSDLYGDRASLLYRSDSVTSDVERASTAGLCITQLDSEASPVQVSVDGEQNQVAANLSSSPQQHQLPESSNVSDRVEECETGF